MLTYIDKNPEKFAQSTCIYTDDKGNVFRLFIRANTKREVLEFIENSLETGAVKVKAEVIPQQDLEERFKGHREDAESQKRAIEEDPTPKDIPFPPPDPMAGITLQFEPVQVEVPEGHKIVYEIDPTLELNQFRNYVHRGSTIEVSCTTEDGIIETSVHKLATFGEDRFLLAEFQTKDETDNKASFFIGDNPTREWLIRVTGRDTTNEYVIHYW